MEILNAKNEYNLLIDQDINPCASITLIDKSMSSWHAGHANVVIKAKQQLPDHKIVCRLYMDMNQVLYESRMINARFDPDTKAPIQIEGTLSNTTPGPTDCTVPLVEEWLNTNAPDACDYLIVFTYADTAQLIEKWPNKPELWHLAEYLCLDRIDFDNLSTPYDEISIEADRILVEDEFILHPHILDVNMIRMNLIAALTGELNYKIKISGTKDTYVHEAKKYIYDNYSTITKIHGIDPLINNELGIPYFGRIGGMDLTPEQKQAIKQSAKDWKDNKINSTSTISPKWLNGRSYEQYNLILPNDKMILLGRIK